MVDMNDSDFMMGKMLVVTLKMVGILNYDRAMNMSTNRIIGGKTYPLIGFLFCTHIDRKEDRCAPFQPVNRTNDTDPL